MLSVLFGLLLSASIMRSIAIGFYLVGCFVLFGAFFFGNRGPIRPRGDEDTGGLFRVTSRRLRWATKEEQEEAINERRDLPSTRVRPHPPGCCLGHQALGVLTTS